MFGILFRAEVKPELRGDFINFIKWDVGVAKDREPGTLRFDLYEDPQDENAFFVYEAYRDKKAFEEHQKNEPFRRWESDIKHRTLRAPPQLWFQGDAVCSLAMTTNADTTCRAKDQTVPASFRRVQPVSPETYLEFLPAYLQSESALERELDRAGQNLELAEAMHDACFT